jgi:hypothetical protein
LTYISECMRRALAAPTFSPPAAPIENTDATA